MVFLRLLSNEIIKPGKMCKVIYITLCLIVLINSVLLPELYASNLNKIITTASENFGIPAELIYGVIEAESSFNSYAVSSCDARGLMQITRSTWDWICEAYLDVSWSFDDSCFIPEKNVIVGTRFLKWIKDYLDKHKEELNAESNDLLLACYNAGPGAVQEYGFRVPPFKETQNYIAKINEKLK